MSLVIQFHYSQTATPHSVLEESLDFREISIFFKDITLQGVGNKFDTPSVYPVRVFGFCHQEPDGVWSSGKNSCLLFNESDTNHNTIILVIKAEAFQLAFDNCRISIISSNGHRGAVRVGKSGLYHVKLKKPFFRGSQRLVVGDLSKKDSKYNFSCKSEIPKVTIILINYQKYELTYLASVAASSSAVKVTFEILCVNNCNSRDSLNILKERNVLIRTLEQGENLGFAPANNFAAQHARGEYLLFLNNDAFLDKGAVDELLRAFQEIPDCRIAGSILRFPDGTLQEAGATLEPDGHPIRHGRNDSKFKTCKLPRFQSVDYVSGACLMIRKSDFLEMRGFDEKYSPAYYEDTDLCMRTLLYGQKVYLASRANCYHIENATTSTIENGAWATRTAEAHRQIFLKDWGGYLASRDPEDLPWHLKT